MVVLSRIVLALIVVAVLALPRTESVRAQQIPGDAKWSLVTDAPGFGPRDCAGALTFNGRMWLLGGWNPHQDPTTNSEVWSSANGSDWQLETIAPWEGRHCGGYAVHQGKMWIVGDLGRLHHPARHPAIRPSEGSPRSGRCLRRRRDCVCAHGIDRASRLQGRREQSVRDDGLGGSTTVTGQVAPASFGIGTNQHRGRICRTEA